MLDLRPAVLPRPWTTISKVKGRLSVATELLSAGNNWPVWRRNSSRRTTSLVRDVANWLPSSAYKSRPSKSGSRTDAWRTNASACPSPGPSPTPCSLLISSKPPDILTRCRCPAIRPLVTDPKLRLPDRSAWTATLLTELCHSALIRTLRRLRSASHRPHFAPALNSACPATHPAAEAALRPAPLSPSRCRWLRPPINCVFRLLRRLWPAAGHHPRFPRSTTAPSRATAASLAIALTARIVPSAHQSRHLPLRHHRRPTRLVSSSRTNCTTCPPRKLKFSLSLSCVFTTSASFQRYLISPPQFLFTFRVCRQQKKKQVPQFYLNTLFECFLQFPSLFFCK